MAGVRDKFVNAFGGIASLFPTPVLNAITGQKVFFPFYHAISDADMPHIDHLYRVKTRKQFIADLDFLLRYYKPMDLPVYLKSINEGRPIHKSSFLLSFDDGLRQFYDVISPILIQKGVPAICFLNSGFIDNQDLFYRYKVSLLIEQFKTNPELERQSRIVNWQRSQARIDIDMISYLRSIQYANRGVLDELAQLIDVDFNDFLSSYRPYLQSDQIRELIDKGFYFGGHSIDHPEYQYISEEEQVRQTLKSIDHISNRFELKYKIFSFPFTDYKVNQRFFKKIHTRENLDATFGCAGIKKEEIDRHVQRMSFERKHRSARQILHGELLYYRLSALIGKNVIYRS